LQNDVPVVADIAAATAAVPVAAAVAASTPAALAVSLLVQSEPAGADVALDGKVVGKTPVSVALDPRLDHLLTLEHKGCSSVVQLVATDSWRTGRSPEVMARLDCK
jgi:hypothetical protein